MSKILNVIFDGFCMFVSIHSSVAKMYSTSCHLQSMVELELWSNLTNKCFIKIMCFVYHCYIYWKVLTE